MSRLPPVGRNRTTAPLRGGWQSKAFSLMPCKDVKLYNSGAESCDGQSIHYQESCRVLQTAFAAPWHNTEVMIIYIVTQFRRVSSKGSKSIKPFRLSTLELKGKTLCWPSGACSA